MSNCSVNQSNQSKSDKKVNLLGLTHSQMIDFFLSKGQKAFRAQQMLKWIHHECIDSFDKMSNFGKQLRLVLEETAEIKAPEIVQRFISKDGTRKWVVRVASGSCVETVFIPEKNRGTLCVSSQAGCSLDCSFCSTGKQGFNSNLTTAEIIGQVWLAAKDLNSKPATHNRRITNVVMMGMGEPLMNFNNVVDAMNLMMDDLGYGLSKRRVTLSTSGVVPKLIQLANVTDVSLAVSLHAGNDALRNQLVPINRKYPLATLMDAINFYMNSLPDRRVVTIEYTLISNINDQQVHAIEVAELLKNMPCKINLIPFNPFPYSDYERPSNNKVHQFQTTLTELGFHTTIRKTRGDDIDAACGQLVGQVNDQTRRQERYVKIRELI